VEADRETERMMELQDVILKAMAKKIAWMEAAEIAGVADRTMRRIRQRYQRKCCNCGKTNVPDSFNQDNPAYRTTNKAPNTQACPFHASTGE
jgi:hypothetical protein